MVEETTEEIEQGNDAAPDKITQLNEQKRHWREKAEAEKAAREAAEKKLGELESKVNQVSASTAQIELATKHGLQADEIRLLEALAAKSGKLPTEMLEDDTFKTYREGKSAKGKLERSVPDPSNRVQVVGDKTYSELPEAERKATYAKTIETLVDKARGRNRNQSL